MFTDEIFFFKFVIMFLKCFAFSTAVPIALWGGGGEMVHSFMLEVRGFNVFCYCSFPSHVNQELQEAINTMYTNASVYLNKMRGAPNTLGTVGPKPSNFPQGMVGQVLLSFP